MPNRIIGLIRASSDRQDTTSQKNELEQYIISKGFEREDITWVEAHASATKPNQNYINLLSTLKQLCVEENIRYVAVWHLNRLARIDRHLFDMKEFFLKHKIQLYCKEPSFQILKDDFTEDSGGLMIFNIFAEFIRQENEERVNKLVRGKNHYRNLGFFQGGKILYGYDVDTEGRFIINPEESKVIQRIFDSYDEGKSSVYSIAKDLTLLNITKRGVKFTAPMVFKIIKNRNYVGIKREEGHDLPSIVSEAQFKRVNAMLVNNQNKKSKEYKNVSLASQLIRCSVCGKKYYRETKRYLCIRKKKSVYDGCDGPGINGELLDRILAEIAVPLHIGYLMRGNANDSLKLEEEIKEIDVKIESLSQNIVHIKEKRDKLMNDYYSGRIKITDERYNSMLKSNENEEVKNNVEIEALRNRKEILEGRLRIGTDKFDLNKFIAVYEDIRRLDNMSDNPDRTYLRDIIRSHVEEITTEIDDDKRQYLHIKLEDGRMLDFRYSLPFNFPSGSRCIGQMRIDGGEWEDTLFAHQSGRNCRKYYVNRHQIMKLTDEAFKMQHDIRNEYFYKLAQMVMKNQM